MKNLSNLIANMNPILHQDVYVFVSLPTEKIPENIQAIGRFKEEEGETIILEKSQADELGFHYRYEASWITLNVHSSLEAVGFTAAISSELTKHGISCNVIAAYYHDHLFVDIKDGMRAMDILTNMKV